MSRGYPLRQATDAHEDRWSTLSLSSRTANINPDLPVDEIIENYIAHSTKILGGSQSDQEQTVNKVAKKNQDLQAYTDQITRQLETIRNEKTVPSHFNRFPISNYPTAKPALFNTEYLPSTIITYEERVQALETEMSNREKDVLKMSAVITLLIEENKYLRDHIAHKNGELNKILQTIGLNDGEIVHELRHEIQLLKGENDILINHLEQQKNLKNSANNTLQSKSHEIAKISKEFQTVNSNLGDALVREVSLTNHNQKIDAKYQKSQEEVERLQNELSSTRAELDQLKENYHSVCDNLKTIKKNFQELESKKDYEVDDLVQKNTFLSNEIYELQKRLEQETFKNEGIEKELKKATRDLNSSRLEAEEYSQRVLSLKNELANMSHAYQTKEDERVKTYIQDSQVKKLEERIGQLEADYKSRIEIIQQESDKKLGDEKLIIKRLTKPAPKSQHEEIKSLQKDISKLKADLSQSLAKNNSNQSYSSPNAYRNSYNNYLTSTPVQEKSWHEKSTNITDESSFKYLLSSESQKNHYLSPNVSEWGYQQAKKTTNLMQSEDVGQNTLSQRSKRVTFYN